MTVIFGSFAVIVFFVLLLVFPRTHGASQAEIRGMTPAQIREMFTGNWMQRDSMGSLVLRARGGFTRRLKQDSAGKAGEWLYEGTWGVTNGVLTLGIANAVARNAASVEPTGSVDNFTVSELDGAHLVLEKDGTSIHFRR